MTLREFLYEQDFEVQGEIAIAEYDIISEKRLVLCYGFYCLSDEMLSREIAYVYCDILKGESYLVIELKEEEE